MEENTTPKFYALPASRFNIQEKIVSESVSISL